MLLLLLELLLQSADGSSATVALARLFLFSPTRLREKKPIKSPRPTLGSRTLYSFVAVSCSFLPPYFMVIISNYMLLLIWLLFKMVQTSGASPFRECVGVWKSVRGLSLQEGALLSVLLRLVRCSCRLVGPVAQLGTSLNICKSQAASVSSSLTCFLFQKANTAMDIRDY